MLAQLVVAFALCHSRQARESHGSKEGDCGIRIDDLVLKHVHLAYSCWEGVWGDTKWQHLVPAKATRWCGNTNKMMAFIEDNEVGDSRTLVLQRRHLKPEENCTHRPEVVPLKSKTLKWIKICESHQVLVTSTFPSSTSATQATRTASPSIEPLPSVVYEHGNRPSGCRKTGSHTEIAYDLPANWPRRIFELSGARVTVSCVQRSFVHKSKFMNVTTCDYEFPNMLMKALVRANASLRAIKFPLRSSYKMFVEKDVNIFMFYNSAKSAHARLMEFAFVELSATTFYVNKPTTKPISISEIAQNSQLALSLLLASLLLSFLTLKLMDSLQRGSSPLSAGAGDAVMFLIATFYGTSSDLPPYARWPNSQRVLICTWLLSTLSLSVYIRGELTSWLNISVPVRAIEDPVQLDAAIQEGLFHVCLADDVHKPPLSGVLSTNTVLGRLTTAVQRSKPVDAFSCFACAEQQNRACVAMRQNACFRSMYYGEYLESKESLWSMPHAVLACRDFRLWKAFRALALRVIETGWRYEDRVKCQFTAAWLPVKETKNLSDFTAVGYTFLVCYCISFVVFCVEVYLGRRCCH